MRYRLKTNIPVLGKIFAKYDALWRAIFVLIILLLNFSMLVAYDSSNGSRYDDPNLFSLSSDQTKLLLLILGICSLLNWILIVIPKLIMVATFEFVSTKKSKTELYLDRSQRGIIQALFSPCLKHKEFKRMSTITLKILSNLEIMHMFLCLVSIILGLALHPLYFTFLLTYCIAVSERMNKMLKALWEPKISILFTLILMILIVYMFVVLAYGRFSTYYPNNTCSSILECFTTSFDQTLKNSGIGNYLDTAYVEQGNTIDIKYERVLYDNIEFLFITLLLLGIISGIIIDKFTELRQQRESFEMDRKIN